MKAFQIDGHEVVTLLSGYKFNFANEAELQKSIATVLHAKGWDFSREHRFNAYDRPDFYFGESGLVIEVKIKDAATKVFRQLQRYAEHEFVKEMVLVTTRSLQAAQMPAQLNGKPLLVLVLRSL